MTGQDLTKNSLYDLDLELSLPILVRDTPSSNGDIFDITLIWISYSVLKLWTGQAKVNGGTDRQTDGRTDRQTDGRTDNAIP